MKIKQQEVVGGDNARCDACLCRMVKLTPYQRDDLAWIKESLEAGDNPSELMRRIFYGKVRQMDFHFTMAFNRAMNKAGRPVEGQVESFLEAIEESTGLKGLAALEAEPGRAMKVI